MKTAIQPKQTVLEVASNLSGLPGPDRFLIASIESPNLSGFQPLKGRLNRFILLLSMMAGLNLTGLFTPTTQAQSDGVSINTDGADPDASAILDVKSSNKGMLMPRMTSAERDAIVTPAIGLMIYNTDRKCTEWYTGTEWQSATPAGTIKAFGGTAVPDGWLLCDGASVDNTIYADLFSTIGTNFGGSGSNFNLPDLRGRFLRGQDQGTGRDENAASRTASNTGGATGDALGTLQGDATALPNSAFTSNNTGAHSHSISVFTGGGGTGINFDNDTGGLISQTGTAGNHAHTITGGGDSETRPENVAVRFIIKY